MSVGESLVIESCIIHCYTDRILKLDFSNILSKSAIERLAQVDEYEVVREVQVRSLLSNKHHFSTEFVSRRNILQTTRP